MEKNFLQEYKKWIRKRNTSLGFYFFMNFLLFFVLASTAILNLFTLSVLENHYQIKMIFLTISVLSAAISFSSSLLTLYNFNSSSKDFDEKSFNLQKEINFYVSKNKNKIVDKKEQLIFLEKIQNILDN